MLPNFFEELSNTKNAVGTALKLALGKPKHFEYFYKDFKDKYDKVQPLAEKLHDRMSGFKQERETMEKEIAESSVPDGEKNEYQEAVKEAYDTSEKYLIPIPYRLEKMEGSMRNMKTADKTSNFKSRSDNRLEFHRAYNDIKMAMVSYKLMVDVVEDIKNKISAVDDKTTK